MGKEEDLTRYGLLNDLRLEKEQDILNIKEEMLQVMADLEDKKNKLTDIADLKASMKH